MRIARIIYIIIYLAVMFPTLSWLYFDVNLLLGAIATITLGALIMPTIIKATEDTK